MIGKINRSLGRKIAIPLIIATILVSAASGYAIYNTQMNQVEKQAITQADSVVEQMKSTRAAYTSTVIGKINGLDNSTVKPSAQFQDSPEEIPLPATLVHVISDNVNKKGLYTIDLISQWAINPDQEPDTQWEKQAMQNLINNPDQPQSKIVQKDGETKLLYMAPDTASADACVSCHNNHPDSPKNDFKKGDLMGALVVEIPISGAVATAQTKALMLGGGIAGAIILLSIFILLLIRRYVTKPVTQLKEASGKMAEGDLDVSIDVDSNDEIGQMASSFQDMINHFNDLAHHATKIANGNLTTQVKPKSEKDILGNAFKEMLDNLQALITQIKTSATDVAASSEQLNSAADQAGDAAQQIADSVQEVSDGTLEITEKVQTVAAQSEEGNQKAAETSETASKGKEIVDDTIEDIDKVEDQVEYSANVIKEMGTQSEKIGEIVETINEIAEQTNLLALNAAIEAARAGEQGKGFAVVADEIRGLAEEANSATEDIALLIDSIQESIGNSVDTMDESVDEVKDVAEQSKKAGESLDQILTKTREVAQSVDEIAAGAEQISAASEENSAAAQDISAAIEETSAQVEEVSASSSSLANMAQDLQEAVDQFEVKNG